MVSLFSPRRRSEGELLPLIVPHASHDFTAIRGCCADKLRLGAIPLVSHTSNKLRAVTGCYADKIRLGATPLVPHTSNEFTAVTGCCANKTMLRFGTLMLMDGIHVCHLQTITRQVSKVIWSAPLAEILLFRRHMSDINSAICLRGVLV